AESSSSVWRRVLGGVGTERVDEGFQLSGLQVAVAALVDVLPAEDCSGAKGVNAAHQAYASGAGPPGPGKISSRAARSSSDSTMSTASIAESSCSMVRGPMIGPSTPGRCSSQASATCPG